MIRRNLHRQNPQKKKRKKKKIHTYIYLAVSVSVSANYGTSVVYINRLVQLRADCRLRLKTEN